MTKGLEDKEIIGLADKILSRYSLCDHCLGRVFAKIGYGKTNRERGEDIRKLLKHHGETSVEECWLCSGLMNEIPHFADLIHDSLKGYEFETFLVGSKIDEEIVGREQELYSFAGSAFSEPIKMEVNREVGKILESRLGKTVDFERPTIMAVVDTVFDVVTLQVSSLYVYGRYKKYRRDTPQTRWLCRVCRGKGCRRCGYTGKMYEKSIEEAIAKPFLEKTGGTGESFHGAGREDIDVRMLGNGRPFVLEIINPMIRDIDLFSIEKQINVSNRGEVEVSGLRFSDGDEVVRIKNSGFRKVYRVVFKGEQPLNTENLKKAVGSLQGATIRQFTPLRVAHRRANTVREKYVYSCSVESVDDTIATLMVEAESGTYIKELISGDDGRTRPSISEMIGVPCKVLELDVIEIKGE
ncbi:MAG: tRNA pseudouridine(54/55) synthase Pus10 [Thermoplasmatota archaeon]|jgi:tRNA pseudouridine synthase 10